MSALDISTMVKAAEIAMLPPSARIHYVQDLITKEKSSCSLTLKGSAREAKMKAFDTCLDYLAHIEGALSQAKQQNQHHKAMCARLRAAADRHGLEIGSDYLDSVVIAGLDSAMKIIKGAN